MAFINTNLLKLAWRGFITRKSRFLVSIAGFCLALVIYVLVQFILIQSQYDVNSKMNHTGTHFIAYKSICCTPPFLNADSDEGFYANAVPSQPMILDLLREIRQLNTVKAASPFLLFRIHDENRTVNIGGFIPSDTVAVSGTCCSHQDLSEGRFLDSDSSRAILVELSYAQMQGLKTGDSLMIRGIPYTIMGIVNPGIRLAKADVYMTFREAERAVSRLSGVSIQNLMNMVLVESAGAPFHRQAMIDVQETIGSSALISTYGCYQPAFRVMAAHDRIITILTWVIVIFSALLALKTQFASVNERSHDIGILGALGWDRHQTVLLFLIEALIQTSFGILVGLCILFVGLIILPHAGFKADQMIAFRLTGTGVILVLAGGILAGIIPAWHAVSRLPVRLLDRL
jgi:putative ABC transport system permease protein